MSSAIALKPTTERRTFDVATASDSNQNDAKVDALVAELRKVRASVGTLLRARDLAVLKAEQNAA